MFRTGVDDCPGKLALSSNSGIGIDAHQGLVSNGAKVYVTALPTDDIDGVVKELNEIGKPIGGTAIG
jgi:phenylacetate 2-hydroxylase